MNVNEESSYDGDESSYSSCESYSRDLDGIIVPNHPSVRVLKYTHIDFNDYSDWEQAGEEIGRHDYLETLNFSLTGRDDEWEAFLRGMANNRSIRTLEFEEGYNGWGRIFDILVPFIEHNAKLSKLVVKDSFFSSNILPSREISFLAATFRRCGTTSSLTELDFSRNGLDDEPAAELISSLNNLSHLEKLDLRGNCVAMRGCQSLAVLLRNSESKLKILRLGSNNIRDDGAEVLAISLSGNKALTALHLTNLECGGEYQNSITEIGWSAFSEVLRDSNHTLKEMIDPDLPYDEYPPSKQWYSPNFQRVITKELRHLLKMNATDDKAIVAEQKAILKPEDFSEGYSEAELERQAIQSELINAPSVRELISFSPDEYYDCYDDFNNWKLAGKAIGSHDYLEKLNFDTMDTVGDEAWDGFLRGMANNRSIRTLEFEGGYIGWGRIFDILAPFIEHNAKLSKLVVKDSDYILPSREISFLAATFRRCGTTSSLTELDFSRNGLDDEPAAELISSLNNLSHLEKLDLRGNCVAMRGCQSLAVLLRNSESKLKILRLGSNNIRDDGAEVLAISLSGNKALTALHLTNLECGGEYQNSITEIGWSAFSEVLRDSNHTLKEMIDPDLPYDEYPPSKQWYSPNFQRVITKELRHLLKMNATDDKAIVAEQKAILKPEDFSEGYSEAELERQAIQSELINAPSVRELISFSPDEYYDCYDDFNNWKLAGKAIGSHDYLEKLNFDTMDTVGDEAWDGFLRGMTNNRSIHKLEFRLVNGVWGKTFDILAPFLEHNSKLSKLMLATINTLPSQEISFLAATFRQCGSTSSLTKLIFCGIHLGDEAAAELISSLNNLPHLKELNLSVNGVAMKGCQSLAVLLGNSESKLKTLDLGSNKIGDDEAEVLAISLSGNKALTALFLTNQYMMKETISQNSITEIGWSAFSKVLRDSNHTLKEMINPQCPEDYYGENFFPGVSAFITNELRRLLKMNATQDKTTLAQQKAILFNHTIDIPFKCPLTEQKMFPTIITWIDRQPIDCRISALFELIRMTPDIWNK